MLSPLHTAGTSGFVPLLTGLGTPPSAGKSPPSVETLAVPWSPQPSTAAKEAYCLCASPPTTAEANLALNADGGGWELAFYTHGF